MEKLTQIIEKLIQVLGGMVTPRSAVAQGLEILKAFIPSKPADNSNETFSTKLTYVYFRLVVKGD